MQSLPVSLQPGSLWDPVITRDWGRGISRLFKMREQQRGLGGLTGTPNVGSPLTPVQSVISFGGLKEGAGLLIRDSSSQPSPGYAPGLGFSLPLGYHPLSLQVTPKSCYHADIKIWI